MPRRPIPRRGCAARAAGREAKLAYQGHVLMENRHGLAVDGCVTQATGYGGARGGAGDAGPPSCGRARHRRAPTKAMTRGTSSRPSALLEVTPHVAQNTHEPAECDRWAHHAARRLRGEPTEAQAVEEIFGWLKTVGLLRKTRHRGRAPGRVDVHLRGRRLQPGADPQPDLGRGQRA